MRGILIRLAETDSNAAAALKIIAYFDNLASQPTLDPSGLIVATAALAECPAGLQLASGDVYVSPNYPRDGEPTPEGLVERSPRGNVVWLLRADSSEITDALILERSALALDDVATKTERRSDSTMLHDPQLVVGLIGRDHPEAARRIAAEELSLRGASRVRVVAVDSTAPGDAAAATVSLLARALHGVRPKNVANVEGLGVAILPDQPDAPLEAGLIDALRARHGADDSPVRCGISSAVDVFDAPDAWDQAVRALKFSVLGAPEQAVTSYDDLGPVALFADLPVAELKAQPDVLAIERLRRGANGHADVKLLDVFCYTTSLRAAAAALHLHHSSVAARISHLEAALGWSLDSPAGRFRARLAILVDRLTYNR